MRLFVNCEHELRALSLVHPSKQEPCSAAPTEHPQSPNTGCEIPNWGNAAHKMGIVSAEVAYLIKSQDIMASALTGCRQFLQ